MAQAGTRLARKPPQGDGLVRLAASAPPGSADIGCFPAAQNIQIRTAHTSISSQHSVEQIGGYRTSSDTQRK